MPFYHVPLSIGLSLLHIYVWRRAIRGTLPPGRTRRILTVALIVLDLLMVATLLLATQIPVEVAQWFAWPGWIWFGAFFYLTLTLLALEIPRLALRRWARREPERDGEEPVMSRRLLLARGSAVIAGVTATAMVGVGMPVALGPPAVRAVRIPLRRLDQKAAGCRIALISDIHLDALAGKSAAQRIVDIVNAQRVDIVAIAGDLVDGHVEHLAEATEPLRQLKSTHGTFFVTGNHEYYYAYDQWVRHVRSLGIRTLLNERTTITHNGGSFELAGLIDPNAVMEDAPGPDLDATLRGWDRERAVVLLAHQPAPIDDAAAAGVDLQLSGHTHGGQIAPFNLLVSALEGTVAGLSKVGDTTLYVTRGAGFYGPPLRVGAPPDITVIELTTP